jgi:hypothetical protein
VRGVRRAAGRHLTYANVLATAAMFIALGGGAYAALTGIPDPQGVFHACVDTTTGALRIVKTSSSCRGARTVRRGHKRVHLAAELPVAWNQAGQKGAKGDPGQPGQSGPTGAAGRSALTPLRSGETETGLWGMGFQPAAINDVWRPYAAFPIPLPADLDSNHVIYVPGASATNCPGVGQAVPGYLCIYQQRLQGSVNQPVSGNIENPDNPIGAVGAGAYGFAIYLVANGTTKVDISGLYSVTAP